MKQIFMVGLSLLAFSTQSYAAEKEDTAPESIKLSLRTAEVKKVGVEKIKLLKAPSSHKTKAVVNYWKKMETPNLVHPPAFTYKVKENLFESIAKVVWAAVLADRKDDKEDKKFELDLKLLSTEEEVLAATKEVFAIEGFGNFEKHEFGPKMLRVFEGKEKRTLYGGLVSIESGKISLESTVVLVVDSEYSEITGIAGGELFGAFDEGSGN